MFVSKYAPRGEPDRARLEQLARNGSTLREIALALDRSITTVRYWLRRWDIRRSDARLRRVDVATAPRETMRACSRHGRAAYRLDARGTYRCVLCGQERVAERRRRIKQILIEEAGGRCAECGYDRLPAALHFHHIDPTTKEFGLSAHGLSRGLERAREEARKCVLLCGNCHAEVEGGCRVLQAPPGGFEPPRTD
jgi:5-methylcytosine-specific restriction endonuclease McrA